MQQVRDVAPIADIDLLPGVVNRGMRIRGILQLDDAQGHAVDKQKHIRAAVFHHAVVHVLDLELVDHAEHIGLRMVEVNQRHHTRDAILRSELDAVDHPAIQLMQRGEIALCTGKAHRIHDLPDFIGHQVGLRAAQKMLQIVQIQHIALRSPADRLAREVMPPFRLQKGDKGVLKFIFAVAAIVVRELWHRGQPPSESEPRMRMGQIALSWDFILSQIELRFL